MILTNQDYCIYMHNKSLSVNNEWGETKERRKTQRLQNSAKKNKTIFLNWKIFNPHASISFFRTK